MVYHNPGGMARCEPMFHSRLRKYVQRCTLTPAHDATMSKLV